jgi:peroxiredoxin
MGGPCVAELSEFAAMHQMYRRRDFELVTISADSPQEKAKALGALKRKQV